MNELTSKKFWIDVGIRAIRTMAQTALAGMTVGATVAEINWGQLLSASAVAALYSFLMSLDRIGTTPTPTQPATVLETAATTIENGGDTHDTHD